MLHLPYNLSNYQNDLDEILLADIALKIQLTSTEFDQAVTHYKAIEEWLERPDSPLRGKVLRMYPQGSMAIYATISSIQDKEEFDIDIVVELDLSLNSDPEEVLNLLFEAIRGEKGSRYYSITEKNSRCVTVHYRNMHLDLCPAVLISHKPARTSTMFHHNEERDEKYIHIRNPWGFANWFNGSLPQEMEFSLFYNKRNQVLLKADAEPVPEPTPIYEKPRKVVALQLLKRFRNNRYESRSYKGPPSVILSKFVIDAGDSYGGLHSELCSQTEYLARCLENFPIDVRNPSCPEDDILTDRWPGKFEKQREFYRDIRNFRSRLEQLKKVHDLPAKQAILAELFGERATLAAFENLQHKYGNLSNRGAIRAKKTTAGIAIGASGISGQPAAARSSVVVPRHHSHSC